MSSFPSWHSLPPLEHRPSFLSRISLNSRVWPSVALNTAVWRTHDDTAIFARRHAIGAIAVVPARSGIGRGQQAQQYPRRDQADAGTAKPNTHADSLIMPQTGLIPRCGSSQNQLPWLGVVPSQGLFLSWPPVPSRVLPSRARRGETVELGNELVHGLLWPVLILLWNIALQVEVCERQRGGKASRCPAC